MPYIDPMKRPDLVAYMHEAKTSGELNYMLTQVCLGYLANMEESYQIYNDIMGALEGCKLEMYRRQISAYEDEARQRNGDVYPKKSG